MCEHHGVPYKGCIICVDEAFTERDSLRAEVEALRYINEQNAKLVEDRNAQIAILSARNARLVEALRPFVLASQERFFPSDTDTMAISIVLTVGQYRAASRALAEQPAAREMEASGGR